MNECTICFDSMNKKFHGLTHCYSCGKAVHTKCYKQWKKKVGIFAPDKCLYCQRNTKLYKTHISWWQKMKKMFC